MLTIRTFSRKAKEALQANLPLLRIKAMDKKGNINTEKLYALVMEFADGEKIINERALPEPCHIAFEVARKCLLTKGACAGDWRFFKMAFELYHWYQRNFEGEAPSRASDWYQNATRAVYEAIANGVVVTRETIRVTKNAVGDTLFYCFCQETQALSDNTDDRCWIADIYGDDNKAPSTVIPYRDRYDANALHERLMADGEELEEGLDELDKEIVRMLFYGNTQREIAEALNLSKGAGFRKIKALRKRFRGVMLQYDDTHNNGKHLI